MSAGEKTRTRPLFHFLFQSKLAPSISASNSTNSGSSRIKSYCGEYGSRNGIAELGSSKLSRRHSTASTVAPTTRGCRCSF